MHFIEFISHFDLEHVLLSFLHEMVAKNEFGFFTLLFLFPFCREKKLGRFKIQMSLRGANFIGTYLIACKMWL